MGITCTALNCPALTVTNSDRTALAMSTGDSTLVTCLDGYLSSCTTCAIGDAPEAALSLNFIETTGSNVAQGNGYDALIESSVSDVDIWVSTQGVNGISLDGNTTLSLTYGVNEVPSNAFTLEFKVQVTEPHVIHTQDDSSFHNESQKYIWAPECDDSTEDGTGACMGVSMGTNGISVYEHTVADKHLTALFVYEKKFLPDVWYHIWIQVTGSTPILYIDGAFTAIGGQFTRDAVYAPAILGKHSEYGGFRGLIAYVRFYDEEIIVADVEDLYVGVPTYTNFTVTCDGVTDGPSVLTGEESICDLVPCPKLTVVNSDTSNVTGNTADTHLVTCMDGYGSVVDSETVGSFNISCTGVGAGVSNWSNVIPCDEIACPALSVLNGAIPSLADAVHGSEVTVTCDNGYNSSDGSSFVTTCVASAPGETAWTNVLTCTALPCPALTVTNSDSTALAMFTGDATLVTCSTGYPCFLLFRLLSVSFVHICDISSIF